MHGVNYCSFCGGKIHYGDRVCDSCGNYVLVSTAICDAQSPEVPQSMSGGFQISNIAKFMGIFVSLLIPLLGVVLGLCFSVSRDNEKKELGDNMLKGIFIELSIIGACIIIMVYSK